MEFLRKLFGLQKSNSEHGVVIHFNYNKEDLAPLQDLERRLDDVLKGKAVGDYDGNEIAVDYSDGYLFLYGRNAEELFAEIKGTLESTDFMSGANVKLRFGPPEDGVKEIEFKLN
ncbi:hypothetical protein [Imperialibacter roseus]|uniref:Uncharacterized protein n=1 Tax=Imperialibacter roseus TaxID=1324217 RepID=A0ABZ0IVU9_9BACT|nr:hypothetical protein [Imperialibacter roseus]WOK07762.1 hypothetical protein RT717_03875 [Imperialibacter roseus]|tara:strand:+ start:3491 stop:3835 length:345 start_codon:yes stop_codon:yes gene_type:complete